MRCIPPGVAMPDAFGGGEIGQGSYRIRYFDNIKLLGASFTTSLGMATLAGEISYKKNAPALVDAIVDPQRPLPVLQQPEASLRLVEEGGVVEVLGAHLAGFCDESGQTLLEPGYGILERSLVGRGWRVFFRSEPDAKRVRDSQPTWSFWKGIY